MKGLVALPGRVGRRIRRGLRDAGLGKGLSLNAARRLIAASGVFDANWYRAHYPDCGPDPLAHYMKRGAALGHNPSPLFWTAWYADRHPGAAEFGGGPLVHYLLDLGTNPNPIFDDIWYRGKAGKVSGQASLTHFIETGAALGLNPHPLFDTAFYRAGAGLLPGENPLAHFLDSASPANPSPHFDGALYLARYPDVAASKTNPLAHFLMGGVKDLRDPSADFCTARYLRLTPAARASAQNPLVHAIVTNAPREDRQPKLSAPASPSPLTLMAIVPNYNHARFLGERLDAIFAQTELPTEIIFLDDASTDDSLSVAQDYATRSPVPFRIVPSEANSGSPFSQWAKGLSLATTDLVWMAESDDRCAPDLVATLKAAFADPAVTLAYAQSRPIAVDGTPLANDYRDYTDDLSLTRWRVPYVAEGRDEVHAALAHRNTIPNGSAVLFRRSAIASIVEALPDFRQCGDWHLYLACAAAGRIAFTPAVLNDHRRHPAALTLDLARSLAPFQEMLNLRLETLRRFDLPDDTFLATLAAIAAEYHERTVMTPDAPPLATQDFFAPALAAFRAEANRRFGTQKRTLVLLETADTETAPVIEPAKPDELQLLAAVRPAATEPAWPGLTWIEGGARAWIWSAPALWAGNDAAADPRRIAVLTTLTQILQVGGLRATGPQSARLGAAIAARAGAR